MAKRQQKVPIFLTVARSEAVHKWAGWWTHFLNTAFDGEVVRCAKTIFGISEVSGQAIAQSQCQKWKFAENNSLPGLDHFDTILEYARSLPEFKDIQPEDVLNHDYPPSNKDDIQRRKKRSKSMAKPATSEPVFLVNGDLPKPDMSFHSSNEHEDCYEFKMTAVLPLSGVLAIMAMIDDAYSG